MMRISDSSRVQICNSVTLLYKVFENFIINGKMNEIELLSRKHLRGSGHNLFVEEGHWNRRGKGRLPLKERLLKWANGKLISGKSRLCNCLPHLPLDCLRIYVTTSVFVLNLILFWSVLECVFRV
ncbi:hypothetical protein E2C01_077369 [Portunus trituberculatus]|uniref:Uncharacterized protein n=1 Tax=Portunus trituberculatus TaxID=210409 RepID=A0A5B7IL83_PORTR|nr:hypothetical protein [Portunus trituberculatus]